MRVGRQLAVGLGNPSMGGLHLLQSGGKKVEGWLTATCSAEHSLSPGEAFGRTLDGDQSSSASRPDMVSRGPTASQWPKRQWLEHPVPR